jgi:hypothetical protein
MYYVNGAFTQPEITTAKEMQIFLLKEYLKNKQ